MLKRLCKEKNLKLLGVLKPKSGFNAAAIGRKFGFTTVIVNCNNKVWCMAADTVEVEILIDSERFFHLKIVVIGDDIPWFVALVYAKCEKSVRDEIWDFMKCTAHQNDAW